MGSQTEDVPRDPFTFLNGDPTYPKEFGALGVALEGFKAVKMVIPVQFELDF